MRITFFCLTAVGGLFAVGLLCVAGEPQAKVVPVSKDSSHDTDRKAILQSGATSLPHSRKATPRRSPLSGPNKANTKTRTA